jgi:hypothetical protein
MAGVAAVAGRTPYRGGNYSDTVGISVAGSGGTGAPSGSLGFIKRIANIGNINIAVVMAGSRYACRTGTGCMTGGAGNGMIAYVGMVASGRAVGGDDVRAGMAGGAAVAG